MDYILRKSFDKYGCNKKKIIIYKMSSFSGVQGWWHCLQASLLSFRINPASYLHPSMESGYLKS